MVPVGSKPDMPIGTHDEQRDPLHTEEAASVGIETNPPRRSVGGDGGDGALDHSRVDGIAHQSRETRNLGRRGTGAPDE